MPDRSLRLFFALPCPPSLAERIGRWRDDRPLPGRQVATANLHLTLAFLGQVSSARLEALLDMAAAIEAAPFDLCLDRLLRWRNGILLLAPANRPAPSCVCAAPCAPALPNWSCPWKPAHSAPI